MKLYHAALVLTVGLAIFLGVFLGIKTVAGTTLGDKQEAQQLVRDIVTKQLEKAINSGDATETARFKAQIEQTVLDTTREGTGKIISGVRLTDDPALMKEIRQAVIEQVKASLNSLIARVDVTKFINASDPHATELLLAPLAQQLPGIVAQQLDVNALLAGLQSDPRTQTQFVVSLATGLATEIAKQVDWMPIILEMLRQGGLHAGV